MWNAASSAWAPVVFCVQTFQRIGRPGKELGSDKPEREACGSGDPRDASQAQPVTLVENFTV